MVTLRSEKGAPLTFAEVDGNFAGLDTRTRDGWADIVAELYTRESPQSVMVGQFRDGMYLYELPPNQDLEAFSNFHMPHTWKPGTMIYPHFHFSVNTGDAGVVRWAFEYTWARRHDSSGQTSFPASQTMYLNFTIPANSAYKHFVAEFPQGQGISGSGLEVDAMIMSRIYRQGTHEADTFPGNIYGITVDLHIEVDRASTPSRAPNFYI